MRLGLAARNSLIIITLIVFIVLVLGGTLLLRFNATMSEVTGSHSEAMARDLTDQLERRGEMVARLFAAYLTDPAGLRGGESVRTAVRSVAAWDDLLDVRIYDGGGHIIHAHTGGAQRSPSAEALDYSLAVRAMEEHGLLVRRSGERVDVGVPIGTGGAVVVGLSTDGVRRRRRIEGLHGQLEEIRERGTKQYVMAMAGISTGLLFLGVGLAIVVGRRVGGPIRNLSGLTARIGRGDYDVDIPVERTDEVGDLAKSLRKMVDDLRQTTVSRDYVDSIIRNMKDSLVVIGRDGLIKSLNQATLEMLGYSEKELIGRPAEVIFDGGFVFGPADNVEKVYRSRDGERIPVLFSSAVMTGGDGNAQGVVCVARDITERKLAEEHMLRQKMVLEAINKVFREALMCESEEDVGRTCLAVAEELTGSRFGLIGELNDAGFFDTTAISNPGWDACNMPGPQASALIRNMVLRGIDRMTLVEGRSRVVNDPASHPDRVGTPKGHPEITSFLGVPLKHGGRTIGMIGLANKEGGYEDADREAVETLSVAFVEALMRKRVELAHRESEGKLNAMLQSIGDFMIMMDRDLNVIWANEAARNAFGEDIVGRRCYEAYHRRHEPCEPSPCAAQMSFEDGLIHEHDIRVVDRHGKVMDFHCTTNVALRDNEGRPVAVIEISRDVTERNRAMEGLVQAAKMASLGEVGAGIAHELNSPLAGILSLTELMMHRMGSDDPNYPFLEKIKDATVRSKYIIRDLLTYSQPSREEMEPLFVNEALKSTLSLFVSELKTFAMEISADLDQDLPQVVGNKGQLMEVFLNIMKNARDAMGKQGRIEIRTRTVTDGGREFVVVEIADSGPGIPAEIRDRVFDPFFTTKEKGGGLNVGLGLSISHGIVKAHNGRIEFADREGGGTVFRIFLPVAYEAAGLP